MIVSGSFNYRPYKFVIASGALMTIHSISILLLYLLPVDDRQVKYIPGSPSQYYYMYIIIIIFIGMEYTLLYIILTTNSTYSNLYLYCVGPDDIEAPSKLVPFILWYVGYTLSFAYGTIRLTQSTVCQQWVFEALKEVRSGGRHCIISHLFRRGHHM